MKLDKTLFAIHAFEYVGKLCDFIRNSQLALHRDGILVPLSGGLDSSTVLLLCARAVGARNVTALFLPEKQGNPKAARYARQVTSQHNIKMITRNITPILARLGTYNFILSAIPFLFVQERLSQRYLRSADKNPFLQIAQGSGSAFERRGFSRFNSKHRVRAVMTYMFAEEMNYLVAGSAHRSEDMVGLFVKFGVDDSADIMPLKNLYRSHIVQLAAHLGVPKEIVARPPNPEIIPGVSDKYMDILGMPSDTLDLLIYGIEHGLADDEIASQLSLPLGKVQQIHQLILQTEHMRRPSQSVSWE